jgi:GntP family gluconate:H+ symporter
VHSAALARDWYLPACVVGTVVLLLAMVMWLRLHAALGLIVAAVGLGIASGMPLDKVPASFANGVGFMMGHIAIILAMGALIGRLLADSGGAMSLGRFLVEDCGPRGMPWALLALGLLVGLPVFFEVGLVLLMPIIVDAAERCRRPAILVGVPVMAGLSAMHGLAPPHPGAMLGATVYHADVGKTILWAVVIGTPAAALSGPVLERVLTRLWQRKPQWLAAKPAIGTAGTAAEGRARVGVVRALVVILLPVALIFLGSWADKLTAPESWANRVLRLVGYPDIAMTIAALVALAILGMRVEAGREHGGERLRRLTADSFSPIAGVLVILSAAGGLSGVLKDSGAAQATVALAMGAHLPPLVLAWAMAAVVRVCMGSATVALAVASGVLAPLAGHMGVNPEMLLMATGFGSLILSHVNDSGFWLVSSLFRTDVKETLATWSAVETVLSVAGLGVTLAFAALVR